MTLPSHQKNLVLIAYVAYKLGDRLVFTFEKMNELVTELAKGSGYQEPLLRDFIRSFAMPALFCRCGMEVLEPQKVSKMDPGAAGRLADKCRKILGYLMSLEGFVMVNTNQGCYDLPNFIIYVTRLEVGLRPAILPYIASLVAKK